MPASRAGQGEDASQQLVAISLYILPLGSWADGLELAVLVVAVVLTVFTGVDYVRGVRPVGPRGGGAGRSRPRREGRDRRRRAPSSCSGRSATTTRAGCPSASPRWASTCCTTRRWGQPRADRRRVPAGALAGRRAARRPAASGPTQDDITREGLADALGVRAGPRAGDRGVPPRAVPAASAASHAGDEPPAGRRARGRPLRPARTRNGARASPVETPTASASTRWPGSRPRCGR